MKHDARIAVIGAGGMVGSAIARRLDALGYQNVQRWTRARAGDMRDPRAVDTAFRDMRPDVVFLAAARVGGIADNATRPGEFARDNLQIQTNVIEACRISVVSLLVFLGSSCMYPRACRQPMREDDLWTGPLEPTNSAYAAAKLAGVEMCEAYARQWGMRSIVAIPCNLYGPGDDFDPETAHALPAMIGRFERARASGETPVLWGTGTALREWLHVDDAAEAIVGLAESDAACRVNVGSGEEVSVYALALTVAGAVEYSGPVFWDRVRPDGMPRKVMDCARLRALLPSWRPRTLTEGIRQTVEWFRTHA